MKNRIALNIMRPHTRNTPKWFITLALLAAAAGFVRGAAFTPIAVDPTSFSLRVGCLRQRADLPPKKQIWCRSSLAWAERLGDLPKLDRQ